MRYRPLLLLFVAALIATSCGGSEEAASSEPDAPVEADAPAQPRATAVAEPDPTTTTAPSAITGPEPVEPTAAPDPTTAPEPTLMAIEDIGTGPYDVGVQTITLIDAERDRTFFVDVWFPLADGVTGDLVEYTFVTGDWFESARARDVDASNASSDGPFPLVVYSHGSGGVRYLHSDYTETIASHGYVVAAPDHPGNTAIERVLGTPADATSIALDRPLDVIDVIDVLVAGDGPAAPFQGLIDAERIAVTGHSFGGYTAYAVAAGVETAEGSSPADSRVDALIPLAPAIGDGGESSLITADALAEIELPTLIMVGTDDVTTPVDPHVETAWTFGGASPHYRLELVDAEHQTFTDLCDYAEVLPQREAANPLVVETIVTMSEEGCSPGDMPIERAKALTNTFAVAFLESVFRGGEMFTPETHEIPDDVIFAAK